MLGNQEVVVKVGKILDELDVKAPQVAISTVIGELTLNDDEEFGVDYFCRASKKVAGTTNFTGIPPFSGGATFDTAGNPVAGTGSVFDPGKLLPFSKLATS